MKKKIESLTLEQQAMMSVYRDKWMAIGLCTEPADRPRAETALRLIYKESALTTPKQIVWVSSPMSGALVISFLKNEKLMKQILGKFKNIGAPKIEDSVVDSVGDSVVDSVVGLCGGGIIWSA